jgi:hypothetical protein
LIEVSLFTGYVKGERPVSLLIVAEPESGKTELVGKSKRVPGVLYLTDATAFGIINKHWDDIESRNVRHIIIPDLTVPLGKQAETRAALTRFLSALIEEGAVELQSYAVSKVGKAEDIRCGLITTITPAALRDQRTCWRKFGFMTRMLPVSYSYSAPTVDAIFESMMSHQYRREPSFSPGLPTDDVEVTLPEDLARDVNLLVRFLAMAENIYGFRYQRQLQTLMMGSALYNGRKEVNREDYDFVARLPANYLNLDCRPI